EKGDGKDQVANEILNEHKHKCGIVYCQQRCDTTDIFVANARDTYKKKEKFQAWLDTKALVMCYVSNNCIWDGN
ncbi:Hypothetical predicted protein, partial [Paramuricea clavata]